MDTSSATAAPRDDTRAVAGSGELALHQIVQFDHAPGVEDLDALLAAGFRVVAMVPDDAVMVISEQPAVVTLPGVRWAGRFDPADKLSPELAVGDSVWAVVEFHGDVGIAEQDALAAAEGVHLERPVPVMEAHALVSASREQLEALARHDGVAYIFPADPAFVTGETLLPCAGMLTASGPVAQYANVLRGWALDADRAAHLGYAFGPVTPKAPANTVRAEILRALNDWSKQVNVIFHEESSATAARSVLISFLAGPHGDPYPFDGPGGVLAHTFYPVPGNAEPMAGDMHLDADENWHTGGDVDIYSVALHEAGHAIGLVHSDKPGDVMYPYYRRGMALSANDIGAAQRLYGPASGGGVSSPVTSAPAPLPVPVPVRLALDAVAAPGDAKDMSLSGLVTGGTAPFAVQWQTDHGYSGKASMGTGGYWLAAGVTLVTGANTVTISVLDAAHQSAAQSVAVTRLQSAPVSGSAPVTIQVSSPSAPVYSTTSASIALSGHARGGAGITQVSWKTAAGASGVATGADNWLVAGVPLLSGTNTILLRAADAKGASAWASVVVVRR